MDFKTYMTAIEKTLRLINHYKKQHNRKRAFLSEIEELAAGTREADIK